ncbi:hypothetical protein HK28_06305 [Acetobacter sp. DsW_063]|nr:hypothetical protein HK28_06305 [Acetobacter sp. DsW_063]
MSPKHGTGRSRPNIARTYGYKEVVYTGKRSDYVSASWHYQVDDIIILKATKRRAGGHRA